MCTVATSTIPNAGLGLFARRYIRSGTVLGQYEGKLLSIDEYKRASNKDYMYQVNRKGCPTHYIDGMYGNQLSRVNGAKANQSDLVNVCTYQANKKIFFRTVRDIHPGQEVIQSYGGLYW